MSQPRQGRFLEDFSIGETYDHPGRRVATDTDRVWLSLLTMNQHPMHVAGEEGKGVLPVTWTLAVLVGLSVEEVSWNATANLAWENVSFGAAVSVGDTISASTTVIDCDAAAGTVTVVTTGRNQHEETVATVTRTIAVRRGSSVESKERR